MYHPSTYQEPASAPPRLYCVHCRAPRSRLAANAAGLCHCCSASLRLRSRYGILPAGLSRRPRRLSGVAPPPRLGELVRRAALGESLFD